MQTTIQFGADAPAAPKKKIVNQKKQDRKILKQETSNRAIQQLNHDLADFNLREGKKEYSRGKAPLRIPQVLGKALFINPFIKISGSKVKNKNLGLLNAPVAGRPQVAPVSVYGNIVRVDKNYVRTLEATRSQRKAYDLAVDTVARNADLMRRDQVPPVTNYRVPVGIAGNTVSYMITQDMDAALHLIDIAQRQMLKTPAERQREASVTAPLRALPAGAERLRIAPPVLEQPRARGWW